MKKIGRFLTMLALAAVILCVQAAPALAASGSVTAQIPVKVLVTGEAPDPAETYVIVLQANDATCPMPDGSRNGEAVMELRGAGEASFYITYTSPGTYTYTVFQRTGTDEACAYDALRYRVTVTVTGSRTGLSVVVKAEAETNPGVKCPIEFTDVYPELEPVKPVEPGDTPKTGDESNLPLYFAAVGGGALLLAVLFLTRKKADSTDPE